jgi:hypothetical protein
VLISALFLLGFLTFIALFNVMDFNSTVTSYDQRNYETFSFTLQHNEIIFASNESAEILVSLMDGN